MRNNCQVKWESLKYFHINILHEYFAVNILHECDCSPPADLFMRCKTRIKVFCSNGSHPIISDMTFAKHWAVAIDTIWIEYQQLRIPLLHKMKHSLQMQRPLSKNSFVCIKVSKNLFRRFERQGNRGLYETFIYRFWAEVREELGPGNEARFLCIQSIKTKKY